MKKQIQYILNKGLEGQGLNEEEALLLLKNIDIGTSIYEDLLDKAHRLSQNTFKGFGEIHGQIGMNSGPCSKNCKFCFFAEINHDGSESYQLKEQDIINQVKVLENLGVGSISLMATADLEFSDYLAAGKLLSQHAKNTLLFGNWGDLNLEQAVTLKETGFTFYYHALRLREGIDTEIRRKERIETMKNVTRAGMILGSCLEPIGPEHTYEEIVDTLDLLKELDVRFMATMKRIPTVNSCYADTDPISDEEFAKITAVTRLYFGDQLLTMAAHEPSLLCLKAGANFLITESGTNPRDCEEETENGRGLSYSRCQNMLEEAGYKNFKGDFLQRYNDMKK